MDGSRLISNDLLVLKRWRQFSHLVGMYLLLFVKVKCQPYFLVANWYITLRERNAVLAVGVGWLSLPGKKCILI